MPTDNINNHTLSINKEVGSSDHDIMVKVTDVSMVFNMASEQLDNLKEYAMALAKRELRFKEFRALNHISLEIRKGDVFGILGTNGSGKSTLLKIVAGVLDPTEGSVEVHGNIAPLIELGAGFDMDLTARENIYLNGALLGYSKDLIEERFSEIVRFAEIEDFLDIPMKNYSSGMVARIAFSIATVIIPDILVVDEVLSVGDFMFQRKCENRIRQLIEEHGVTVLIVSHSNDQIERLCNRAIWIEKSRCRVIGDAKDVCMVYAGLGGRKGSAESEEKVFHALTNSGNEEFRYLCNNLGGNPYFIASELAKRSLNASAPDIDTIIFASCASHINTVFANTLAKASNALILPLPLSEIPSETLQLFIEMHPKRIIYIDCGQAGIEAFRKVCDVAVEMEIVDLSGTGDVAKYSYKIFQYGLEHDMWAKEHLFLMEYEDEMISLMLTPNFYDLSSPVAIARPSMNEGDIKPILALAADNGFDALTPIGRIIESKETIEQCEQIDTLPLKFKEGLSEGHLTGCHLFNVGKSFDSLCIGSTDLSQWMNYIGLGPYLNITHTSFYPIDPTNLDSIAGCLDLIHASADQINSLDILSAEGALSAADCHMIENALSTAKTKRL